MKEREDWINETMKSVEDIEPASANVFLYDKIIYRIQQVKSGRAVAISGAFVIRVAACLVILIALNVLTILHRNKSGNQSTAGEIFFATEYFSYLNQL